MRGGYAVALVIGAIGIACGPGSSRAPIGRCDLGDAGADGCVELGVGADASVAEESIPLVHGPQGGWHLEVGLRMRGAVPLEDLAVEYEVRNEERVLGVMRYAIEERLLEPDGALGMRRVGDIVILEVEDGRPLLGSRVSVTVRLESAGSGLVEIDRRSLTIVAGRL